jgi:hypothetical protein
MQTIFNHALSEPSQRQPVIQAHACHTPREKPCDGATAVDTRHLASSCQLSVTAVTQAQHFTLPFSVDTGATPADPLGYNTG